MNKNNPLIDVPYTKESFKGLQFGDSYMFNFKSTAPSIVKDSWPVEVTAASFDPAKDDATALAFDFSTKQPDPEPDWEIIPLQRGWDLVGRLYEQFLYGQGFVAGGFVRWACHPTEQFAGTYGDIDIYALSEETYGNIRSNLETLFQKISETDWSMRFVPNPVLDGAYTLLSATPSEINLIKKKFGSPKDVLRSFDLSVCQAAILSDKEVLVSAEFLESQEDNQLRIMSVGSPVSTMVRIAKYGERGFKLSIPEAFKLFAAWEKIEDKTKKAVLEAVSAFELDDDLDSLYELAQWAKK